MQSHSIDPERDLEDLDYIVLSRIADVIGRDWRQFVQVIPGYSIYDIEEFAAAYNYMDEKPAMRVLMSLIKKGRTVRHLVSYLEKVKLEKALLLLKGPEPLHLLREPVSGEFVEDTEMKLECDATGFPFPRYQWYHIYPTKDNQSYQQKLTEGTEKVLSIDPVRREHSGAYFCEVYHYPTPDGRKQYMQTEPVFIKIKPSPENAAGEKPVIIKQPKPVTVAKGKPIVLDCKATGRPEPKYMWYKRGHNNQKLKKEEKINYDQASLTDDGIYSCKVWNRCGEVWSNEVKVTVIPRGSVDKDIAIKIERQPVESVCLIGEKHTFECQAVCKLPLFYQWYKDDEKLQGCTESKLTFDTVKAKDKGKYFCKIWNESGCLQESNFAHLFLKSSGNSIPGEGYFATDKVALLIGNMTYRGSEALTAVNHDVSLLQDILQLELGFKCLSFMNLNKDDMERAVNLFCDLVTENSATDKVALLIGNMTYRGSEALTAVNHDVSLLQDILQLELGFKCLSFMNLNKDDMERAVNLFCDLVTENSYVVFYFSGHGFQHMHRTYMLPIDAPIGYDSSECICVQDVHRKIQAKCPALNNMNLDICRCSNENESGPPNTTMDNIVLGNSVIFCASNVGDRSEALESVGRDGRRPKGIFTDYLTKRIVQNKPLNRILEQVRMDVGTDPQVTNLQYPELQTDLRYPLSLRDPIKNPSYEAKKNVEEFWIPLYRCGNGNPFSIENVNFELRWTWTFSNVMRVEIRNNAGYDVQTKIMVIPECLCVTDLSDKDMGSGASLTKQQSKASFMGQQPKDNSCSVWHIGNIQKATKDLELIVIVVVNNKTHKRKILFPPIFILEKWESYRRAPVGVEWKFPDLSTGDYSSTSTNPPCRMLETMSMNNN